MGGDRKHKYARARTVRHGDHPGIQQACGPALHPDAEKTPGVQGVPPVLALSCTRFIEYRGVYLASRAPGSPFYR